MQEAKPKTKTKSYFIQKNSKIADKIIYSSVKKNISIVF